MQSVLPCSVGENPTGVLVDDSNLALLNDVVDIPLQNMHRPECVGDVDPPRAFQFQVRFFSDRVMATIRRILIKLDNFVWQFDREIFIFGQLAGDFLSQHKRDWVGGVSGCSANHQRGDGLIDHHAIGFVNDHRIMQFRLHQTITNICAQQSINRFSA